MKGFYSRRTAVRIGSNSLAWAEKPGWPFGFSIRSGCICMASGESTFIVNVYRRNGILYLSLMLSIYQVAGTLCSSTWQPDGVGQAQALNQSILRLEFAGDRRGSFDYNGDSTMTPEYSTNKGKQCLLVYTSDSGTSRAVVHRAEIPYHSLRLFGVFAFRKPIFFITIGRKDDSRIKVFFQTHAQLFPQRLQFA